MKEDSWYSIHRISTRLFQVVSDFMRDIFLFCLFVFFFTKLRKQTIKVGVSVLQLLSYCYCRCLLKLFFICTCFNARCSSHYGHFSTVQSIFRKHCLSFPLFFRFFLFALCSSLYIRRVPAREAHLSYLVVTSDQASSLSSLAAWAGTAEDICEEEEEELSKFELPTEGKVFLLNEQRGRGKRRRF